MRHCQVDEFLVVRVFASAGRFDRGFSRHMVLVKAIENVLRFDVGPRHALHKVRVSEHAFQFVAHAASGQMRNAATEQSIAQWHRGGVFEQPQIEHDVGVDHPSLCLMNRFSLQRGLRLRACHALSPS